MTAADEYRAEHSVQDLASEFFAKILLDALLNSVIPVGYNPSGVLTALRSDGMVTLPTQTPLVSEGVYDSGWISLDGYNTLRCLITTDQVSASNGIIIQFSSNGVSVDSSAIRTLVAAEASVGYKFFDTPIRATYMRFRYINGVTGQGLFKVNLEALTEVSESTDSVEATVTSVSIATLTRSVLMAKNDSGVFGPILRSVLGGLRTSIYQQEAELQAKSCSTHRCDMVNVTTGVAQRLDNTVLTDRKYITISNNDATKGIFYGTVSSLTSSTQAISLPAGASHQQEWDSNLPIYAISSSGTCNVSLSQTGGTV